MDISNINLNLLIALEALLSEAHVTRAGEKIHVSQAAMSNSLKQLRHIFNDALLVRGQSGQMLLTPYAQNLLGSVRIAIESIQQVFVGQTSFQAELATRTFHLGLSDYISLVMLPTLIQKINQLAPKIKLVIHHLNYLTNQLPFERGELDLVIGNFTNLPQTLYTQALFTDKPVCVADKKHPAMRKKQLTKNDFLTYPHIMVSYVAQPGDTFIDQSLKKMGYPSPVKVIVPHAFIAIYSLPNTLFMTSTVERIAKPFLQPLGLRMNAMPFKFPQQRQEYVAYQYWHAKNHHDQCHQWLRSIIKNIGKELT